MKFHRCSYSSLLQLVEQAFYQLYSNKKCNCFSAWPFDEGRSDDGPLALLSKFSCTCWAKQRSAHNSLYYSQEILLSAFWDHKPIMNDQKWWMPVLTIWLWWMTFTSWHFGSLWFLKWSESISLFMSLHRYCKSPGRGNSFLATLRLSRWHMLSYAKKIFCLSFLVSWLRAEIIHTRIIKKTCAGPSDLL